MIKIFWKLTWPAAFKSLHSWRRSSRRVDLEANERSRKIVRNNLDFSSSGRSLTTDNACVKFDCFCWRPQVRTFSFLLWSLHSVLGCELFRLWELVVGLSMTTLNNFVLSKWASHLFRLTRRWWGRFWVGRQPPSLWQISVSASEGLGRLWYSRLLGIGQEQCSLAWHFYLLLLYLNVRRILNCNRFNF